MARTGVAKRRTADIAATNAAFAAALARGDAGAAAAAYADDARRLPPAADLVGGSDAIEAFCHAGLDAGIAAVELEALELEADRRLAYELGRYELRLEPADSSSVVDRGTYLLVHARQADGAWRQTLEAVCPARRDQAEPWRPPTPTAP